MNISASEAASMLTKYEGERTPLIATLKTAGTQSSARITGFVRGKTIDGEPFVFVGGDNDDSDFVNFRLVECSFYYGDLREAKSEFAAQVEHLVEGVLTIVSKRTGIALALFERKEQH